MKLHETKLPASISNKLSPFVAPFAQYGRTLLVLLLLTAILAYSAYFRFHGITERGMIHSDVDAWKYLDTAKTWSEGHVTWMSGGPDTKDMFYRPVAHITQAIAIRLWGYNDYSLKLLNTFADLGIITLLFLIGMRLTGSIGVGLWASLFYALIPKIIAYSWSEIPHAVCGLFIIFTLFLYLRSLEPNRRPLSNRILLSISGFCLGSAANIHPDLALLGPGFIIPLFLNYVRLPRVERSFRTFVLQAGLFTLGFFSPFLIGMLCFGPHEVIRIFSNEFKLSNKSFKTEQPSSHFVTFLRVFSVSIQNLFETRQMTWGLVSAFGAAIICFSLKKLRDIKGYVSPILLVTYAAGYALSMGEFPDRMFRLFLPLLPLLCLTITFWWYEGLRIIAKRYAIIPFTLLAIGLLYGQPIVSSATENTWRVPAAGGIRMTYEKLKTWVDPNNRILILPVGAPFAQFFREGQWGLAHPFYFGNNALYLTMIKPFPFPYTTECLRKICLDNRIRYVFVFQNRLDESMVFERYPQFAMLDKNQPHTREKELEIINQFLKESGAHVIGNWEAGLYQLPETFGQYQPAASWLLPKD